MSDEDKELLARIGQLAGQINRHKSQQAGVAAQNHHPAPHRRNTYRHASAPYSRPGYGAARLPAVHRNRTLQLNNPKASSDSGAAGGGPPSGTSNWVSRTDRHRQLINANVYEKEAENRSRAIEETRKRKLRNQRHKEKMRFNDFMRRQAAASGGSVNLDVRGNSNEITIDGVRFRVMDGGKKLARATDDVTATPATPKSTVIAGVKFYRTKSGNLVASRVVQDHRYVPRLGVGKPLTTGRRSGVVKKDEACRIFSTTGKYFVLEARSRQARQAAGASGGCEGTTDQVTGSCPKGPSCRYQHDASKVAVCKDFLKEGKCANGAWCDLSHELSPERVPHCLHYARGNCAKPDCPYAHSTAAPGAPVCEAFGFRGYCDKGAECAERHVFECPDFSNTGSCKTKGCKLPHRERASVLRTQARVDEAMGDVSSDDEAADSDDVDSDEVAEFVEAESDDSDSEARGFLAI